MRNTKTNFRAGCLLLCLAFFSLSAPLYAQSGISCSTAISLNDDVVNQSTTESEIWYTFQTDTLDLPAMEFQVITTGSANYGIETMEIYSGSCSSLNLITTSSVAPNDTVFSDSLDPATNTTYYLRLIRNCTNCQTTYKA